MKKQDSQKKKWTKPAVRVLDIKRVTRGGTISGNEQNNAAERNGPPPLS